MAKKAQRKNLMQSTIDCACVIHDVAYDWVYVERLYRGLQKRFTPEVRLHVYTEPSRTVPVHFVKHDLQEWSNIRGPKKSWWYKLQLFREDLFQGPLFYFDLDTVIVGDLDWMLDLDPRYFWAIHDFKHLWKKNHQGLNSSVMYFDTRTWGWIWNDFQNSNIKHIVREHHGDQDYINRVIPAEKKRFFNDNAAVSYRWQVLDGGYDFKRRVHKNPGQGVCLDPSTSLVIFHGNPKPHQIEDATLSSHWLV